jgi:ion channel-forming bestrophin family protein
VALPPSDDTTGKTPSTDITPLQLRRRKTDALKLVLAFVYAVKHYLREEDGLDFDDYAGVIPESFMRSQSRRQSRRSSVSMGYNAMSEHGSSAAQSRSASPGLSRGTSTDGSGTPAATKRVRVKRSSDNVQTTRSPLIEHRAVDFQAYDNVSMPFPLVFVD